MSQEHDMDGPGRSTGLSTATCRRAALCLVIAAGVASTALAGSGDAPINKNLGATGPLITSGDARVLILHDSQWNVTTESRLHQGAMYEWDPWRWSGRGIPGGDGNARTGVMDLNQSALNVTFTSVNPGAAYPSDGTAGHAALNGGEWTFAGPTVSSPGLGAWGLLENHYGQRDLAAPEASLQWPQTNDIVFRLMFRRTETTVPSLRLRERRGLTVGSEAIVSLAGEEEYGCVEFPVPLALAPGNPPQVFLFGQNNELPGQTLTVTGAIGYVPDAETPDGRRTGLLLSQCGFNGFRAVDHLDKNILSDGARQAMIRDGFEPNVLMIMLGHNDSPARVVSGEFEADLQMLIGDWLAQYDAVGAPHPAVVLVVAWTTDSPTANFHKMRGVRDAMLNLAATNGYGYISLFDYYGGQNPNTAAGLHMDWPYRVHPGNLAAARGLARAIWEQFEEPDVPVDCDAIPCLCEFTCDPGANVDVFDLLTYLDLWFDGDPRADVGGSDPGRTDVFDLLDFLECWFEASTTGVCP